MNLTMTERMARHLHRRDVTADRVERASVHDRVEWCRDVGWGGFDAFTDDGWYEVANELRVLQGDATVVRF